MGKEFGSRGTHDASPAAGTAMATGYKTYNAGIGVDAEGNPVENISERALALGKALLETGLQLFTEHQHHAEMVAAEVQ